MTDTSGWFALAGAAVTGVFGLALASMNHRWASRDHERADQVRESRSGGERLRAAFRDYLVATNAYDHAVQEMHELGARRDDDFDTWLRSDYQALQEKYQYMTILADGDVRRLAREYNRVLYGLRDAATDYDEKRWTELRPETNKSRERLRTAMRAAIRTSD